MKKTIVVLLFLFLSSMLFANGARESEKFIGVVLYRGDDSFINDFRQAIEEYSKTGPYPLRIVHSDNDQTLQNSQVEELLETGSCAALVLNPVDRTSSGLLIEKAKRYDVPIVFYNREPLASDLNRWDKVYYVGADATECGKMVGNLFVDFWKANPSLDKNNDGVIQYVMLKGEVGHQDTELRTEYMIDTIIKSGLKVEKLWEESGRWERERGKKIMDRCYLTYGQQIEAVFSNNDDMALGAIDSLLEHECFDSWYMPITGVDGTKNGIAAIESGHLLLTVQNDSQNQARAIYELAVSLANGKDLVLVEGSVSYPIEDGKYIWIPYTPVFTDRMDIIEPLL